MFNVILTSNITIFTGGVVKMEPLESTINLLSDTISAYEINPLESKMTIGMYEAYQDDLCIIKKLKELIMNEIPDMSEWIQKITKGELMIMKLSDSDVIQQAMGLTKDILLAVDKWTN